MAPDPSVTVVRATAPVRICDNGGWTDTWFAGRGAVFNIAVSPSVTVTLSVGAPGWDAPASPVVAAALSTSALEGGSVDISCDIPAGAATGTSASVAVALLGALAHLEGRPVAPADIARAAHRLEVDTLGLESGVQDQLCAAYGGINFIEITDYPAATVTPVRPSPAVLDALQLRLVLLYLGRPHRSSAVHAEVIASRPRLDRLRETAAWSRDAVMAGDLEELGQAMIANCDAQAALHPALVSADARRVIDAARAAGASGWKVNGAGGDGGSMTLLAGPGSRDLVAAVEALDPSFRAIPIVLSGEGLRVYAS